MRGLYDQYMYLYDLYNLCDLRHLCDLYDLYDLHFLYNIYDLYDRGVECFRLVGSCCACSDGQQKNFLNDFLLYFVRTIVGGLLQRQSTNND